MALATTAEGNADIRIADEDIRQAQSRSVQAKSALLPGLEAVVGDESVTYNLAVLGLPSHVAGVPLPLQTSPLNVFNGRIAATQKILDLSAIRRFRASRTAIQLAEFAQLDVKDRVASRVASAYLVALRAEAQLDSITEDVTLAKAVMRQAEHQLQAGSGIGIEVTRANVQLAHACQKLLAAESQIRLSHLQLLRAIGLSLDTRIELADSLVFEPIDPAALKLVEEDALRLRTDLQVQQARENNAAIFRDAARLERWPTISGFANYGTVGLGIRDSLPTHTVGISVDFPVFDGGRRRAQAAEAESKWRQERIRTADLREQTDLEMRMAIESLRSAEAQVEVALRGRRLANRELMSAQERYEAGVGNNLEVTDAQSRLERSRDNHLDAIFSYNQAMIEFGRTSGTLDQILERMDVAMDSGGPAAKTVSANACAAEPVLPQASAMRPLVLPISVSGEETSWTADEPPAIVMPSQTPAGSLPELIPPPAPIPVYAVQVAVFRTRDAAQRLLSQLKPKYGNGCVVPRGDQEVWRVLVGLESSRSAADSLAGAIRNRDSLPAFSAALPISVVCE